MAKRPTADLSRLRQTLRQTEKQREQHLKVLFSERGPVIRGTYRLQGGRCGKPGCKCTRGELHLKSVLYYSEDGTFRCAYVPVAERDRIENRSQRYQRLRKARTALAKLAQTTLELADALQEALSEPYPSRERRRQKKAHAPPRQRREEPPS